MQTPKSPGAVVELSTDRFGERGGTGGGGALPIRIEGTLSFKTAGRFTVLTGEAVEVGTLTEGGSLWDSI